MITYLIHHPGRASFAVLCLLLATSTAGSAIDGERSALRSSLPVQLAELPQLAMARQHSETGQLDTSSPYRSSAWLAALPSISVSFLRSDEDLGTDETEVSLNLPLKSPYRAARDKALRQLRDDLQETEAQRRKLYLSGLLREALWSQRIASTRCTHLDNKIAQLSALYQRQQALYDARSASRYSLLLLRQEITGAKLMLGEQQLEVAKWRDQFRELTGMTNLPEVIEEPVSLPDMAWRDHPALRMLDLDWQRQQAVLAADSASGDAWNLALQAKQVEGPGFEENQYGLAVDIPLSVFDATAESTRSEWREGSRQYWQQRDELQWQLARSWRELQAEANYLSGRQTLLQQSAQISKELLAETELLLQGNELAREIWVRRVLENLDKQADAAINQLLIGQNRAMTRQAAGIPL
jgi:hypothetical protein